MKACEGVFASGDIANFPLKMLNWDRVSIGHWQISHKHGKFHSWTSIASAKEEKDPTT